MYDHYCVLYTGCHVLINFRNNSMSCFADQALKWLNKEPEMKLLRLIKYKDSDGNFEAFRLITTIQKNCIDLGTQLGIETATLRGIDDKLSQEKMCEEILYLWIMRGDRDYKVTWAGLLEALEDLQLKGVAKHLKTALIMALVK